MTKKKSRIMRDLGELKGSLPDQVTQAWNRRPSARKVRFFCL